MKPLCAVLICFVSLIITSLTKVCAEDVSVIPASQDRELLRKAFTTKVRVDYTRTTVEAVVKDLAKQSGVDIRLDESLLLIYRTYAPQGSSASSGASGPESLYAREAAEELLGEEGVAWDPVASSVEQTGTTVEKFQLSKSVPLFTAIEFVCGLLGGQASYRKGHVFISTPKTLLKEMLVKRKYQLSQTWGSIYTVNFNGKIISVRLNVEDTIAHRMVHGMGDPRNDFELIDVESTNGEPTGIPEVHKRLVALKRGYNVEVDTAYETVAVTAPAWTIADLMDCALYDLKAQDLAPEEAARKAKNFRAAHLAEITGNALKSMTDADKKSLGKAVIELDDGNFDVREGAEKRLLAAGANALLLLNKVDLEKVSAEKRQRIQRLIPLIKNEIETRPVLMAAEAYLAAGMAGNLDAIKKDMWTSGRVKEFQNAEAAYARELAAAKRKPDVLRELQKDAESTFQASLIKLMKVKDARVEKIIVSGSRAEVTYSVEVDAKHPLFEFCQNLKVVRGVMRAQSRFCMENINKKWLAAENRQITDAQPTTWLRSGGDEETTTVGSSISEVQTDENNIEVRVSGSTHAISFGY